MVAIPPTPDEPKVACNSGARTFYSTPKRCNANDAMSNLEIHAGELHATFLRNHNMRHHKGPKQKTAQAQKTPTARGERRPQHSHQPTPTGGFTTIDTPPRRVAGVSHPYGRNSPHTPRATPIHNLTTAAFADATSTPSAPISEPKLRAYPYADSLPSAPCPTATATPPTPTTEPELQASAQPRPRPSHNGLYLQQLAIVCRLKKSDQFSLCKLQRTEN